MDELTAWLSAAPVRAWCIARGLDPARVTAIVPDDGPDGRPCTLVEYRSPGGDESRTIRSWPVTLAWPRAAVERLERSRAHRADERRRPVP